MPITLRTARADEAETLWALRTRAIRASCRSHYAPEVIAIWAASPRPERYEDLLSAGGACVAENDGTVAGYAVLDRARGEIDAVFVDPDHERHGIGRALLAELESIARADGLTSLFLFASLNAEPFYRANGYAARRRDGYPHPSGLVLDCVFMDKALDAASPS